MIIRHLTDNDLYKFTTMNAVQKKFPSAVVRYDFINRGNTVFPQGFADVFMEEVRSMKDLVLTRTEEDFIRRKCYFFEPVFIDLLKGYRYDPDEVRVEMSEGKLKVSVEGLWYRTVLWEVPLLAIISELYYKLSGIEAGDFQDRAMVKARSFAGMGAEISEFGTRRRFSFDVQDKMINILKQHCKDYLNGTSNVYMAMKHNLLPMGTHPHEWFMYHGAHFGYRMANLLALENWVDVYHGNLGIALTDTYTSDNFFKIFDVKYSKLFDGVRWDSGDPFSFTEKVIAHYRDKRIDPSTKTIVYSDALNMERTGEIRNYADGRIHDVYGIGTYLTNDVGAKPLNIVIKMTAAKPFGYDRFIPAVKLSDSPDKHSGDPEEIELCKKIIS